MCVLNTTNRIICKFILVFKKKIKHVIFVTICLK